MSTVEYIAKLQEKDGVEYHLFQFHYDSAYSRMAKREPGKSDGIALYAYRELDDWRAYVDKWYYIGRHE